MSIFFGHPYLGSPQLTCRRRTSSTIPGVSDASQRPLAASAMRPIVVCARRLFPQIVEFDHFRLQTNVNHSLRSTDG